MFSSVSLISTLTLALAVSATPFIRQDSPLITLSVAKRIKATGPLQLLQHDQARAQGLVAQAARASGKHGFKQLTKVVGSTNATNQAVDYVVNVQIGNPATTSPNTWVGAQQPYVQSSTSVQTRDSVSVDYGNGESFTGTEFTDFVSFNSAAGLVIFGQSIGAAITSTGFDDSDGVLGLGPTSLTIGTLSPDTTVSIPTVTDNLFAQAAIAQDKVAISFEPTSVPGTVNGEITWGGTDSSKFVGSINFAPASKFWGIDQQIRFGSSTSILSNTAGIVDSGTTLTLIATDAFQRYQTATGGVPDAATGLLRLTPAQFASLQSLFFTINGVTVEFTANAQIFPRALNTAIGGDNQHVYLIVNDIGTKSGSGLDFINGMTWMERFYVVFDTTNQKVGIANTPFTRATSN